MRRRVLKSALAAGALSGVVVAALVTGQPDSDQQELTLRPVADEGPGHAVEDFAYPQADTILAEQGILLKRGDGHIVLAQCGSSPDLLEIYVRHESADKFCFRTTGASGYLSLELPAVYGVQTKDHATELSTTVDGEDHQYDVAANSWAPVGETADPEGREHVLVEIVTSG
ncbi:hypothetical protein [Streptomyces sp. SM13]|uniref:hypothetical protein n=1 Tax=Streptomyces sp. SM13 TaxID=1983803 RepID=UPI000CD56C89|nr:hypothetical protein [Streptomyces sp. SM13]